MWTEKKKNYRVLQQQPHEPDSGNRNIINVVNGLKTSSQGDDCIPINIIKKILHSILKPLKHVIITSFSVGVFPKKLKTAKVYPLFKTSTLCLSAISILTELIKIFEKIMCIRLAYFLYENDIINNCQYGFFKKFLNHGFRLYI